MAAFGPLEMLNLSWVACVARTPTRDQKKGQRSVCREVKYEYDWGVRLIGGVMRDYLRVARCVKGFALTYRLHLCSHSVFLALAKSIT